MRSVSKKMLGTLGKDWQQLQGENYWLSTKVALKTSVIVCYAMVCFTHPTLLDRPPSGEQSCSWRCLLCRSWYFPGLTLGRCTCYWSSHCHPGSTQGQPKKNYMHDTGSILCRKYYFLLYVVKLEITLKMLVCFVTYQTTQCIPGCVCVSRSSSIWSQNWGNIRNPGSYWDNQ